MTFLTQLGKFLLSVILAQLMCFTAISFAQGVDNQIEDLDDLLVDVDEIDDPEPDTGSPQEETEIQYPVLEEETAVVLDTEVMPEQNAGTLQKDVVLVLDNSGSMRQNDPEFLTSRAVTEFIRVLDDATRLAIIIFDQDVSLAVPLTQVSLSNRGELLDSLDRINYRGLFTDSPAAIERAIYELKNNGRQFSQKLIIFMTDGIVDTGNTEVDLDKSRWLRESLAPDAAESGIKIFGIAFTEDADFRLIQSLAQETGGEYYRALKAEDLGRVFDEINTIIQLPPEPASVDVPQSIQQPPATTPQQPQIIEVQQPPPQTMSDEERTRSIIILAAVVVMILAIVVILLLLLRRGRDARGGSQEYISEAYLNDTYGYTASTSYKLGSKPTMLGRVAGMDSEHLDYIVIPESTIGRRHSLIEYKDYAYWIVDQGSINGTFVNDVPVTSEVRLKHGDRVRLHKYEFEFVMPEMVDAGMTVVSQTVVAASSEPEFAEATELKGDININSDGSNLDFDLSGSADQEEAEEEYGSEDETLMPGVGAPLSGVHESDSQDEAPEFESEDETLMPGSEGDTPLHGTPLPVSEPDIEPDIEDETLMPGDFNLPEEDATIRKEGTDNDAGLDNFLDIGGMADDEKKDKK